MTALSAPPVLDKSLYRFMTESHQHLDQLFHRVLDALQAGAPEARELWTEIDHGLLAHMEAEERFVIPAFARIDRDKAIALIREHGLIRELLLELGIAVDLHCIRFDRARELGEILRVHVQREQDLLYRWSDERLEANVLEATRQHVAG